MNFGIIANAIKSAAEGEVSKFAKYDPASNALHLSDSAATKLCRYTDFTVKIDAGELVYRRPIVAGLTASVRLSGFTATRTGAGIDVLASTVGPLQFNHKVQIFANLANVLSGMMRLPGRSAHLGGAIGGKTLRFEVAHDDLGWAGPILALLEPGSNQHIRGSVRDSWLVLEMVNVDSSAFRHAAPRAISQLIARMLSE